MRRSPRSAIARRSLRGRLAAGLLSLPAAALLVGATPVERFRDDPDRLAIVTAHWKDRAQLQNIAARFQHLVVDEAARTARMEASHDDLDALRRMGVRAEIDFAATDRLRRVEAAMAQRATVVQRHLTKDGTLDSEGLAAAQLTAEKSIPGYACYRTVEETYSTMDQLARRRPTLASVVDIGPSWAWAKTGGASGYRMRALRLNNAATDASVPDKPTMVLLGAIHAREYTTAELLTRFAEWLANGHGTEPEATWLLDNFRFYFVLQANPDGRKKAESGLSWRKNTDTDNGTCSANAYGVDLNRNFSWRFGDVPGGSSGDPCDSTYRGPAAASEEETRNVMRLVVGTQGSGGTFSGGVLPDRRTDTGVAPADYRGMFLDIHSYSQLVLWPWAYTSTGAPNAAALRTLGRRLAYFNGYRPVQWTGLYAADGTNTDTVYGITGAPSYTIELGQEFFEDCDTFESTTFPRNFNALRYAARNLQAPYDAPSGPDSTSIGVSAGAVARGQALAVAAWLDDARFNQSNGAEPVQSVAGASAYLDAAPWIAGASALPMRARDGAFDSSRELAITELDTRSLGFGRHVVYVRGTDASGRRGTANAVYFTVRAASRDYGGDHAADVVWRNGSTGANELWRSANSATKSAIARVADPAWKIVAQGDFDGDGRSDLFWRHGSTGANAIWRSGNAAAPLAVTRVPQAAWRVAAAADFDGDGRADVFWRNVSTGQNVIWRSANSAAPIAVAQVSDLAWQVVGSGDFDGDARFDVLWRHGRTGANAIWRSGNAATPQAMTGVTNQAWKIVGIGDFNRDGLDDVFWRNASSGANVIWRSARSTTQQEVTDVTNVAWKVAAIGDYDGDGVADVLWRNASNGANVIWNHANGATPRAVSTVPGQAWAIVPYENQP